MPKDPTQLSIALVYDHLLTQYGGAELVLDTVLQAFPHAELFTTIQDKNTTTWHTKTKVHTTGLQKYSLFFKHREILDLFTPISLEQFDFSSFDIIISVTSSAAKGVITLPHQLHVCYLLTPTRYLYHDSDHLLTTHPVLSVPPFNWFAQKVLQYLKWWDQAAVWRPDFVLAISNQVAARCEEFYARKADAVLYPPVEFSGNTAISTVKSEAELSQNEAQVLAHAGDYYLCISRLVAYKRIDLAILATLKTNKTLVIVGTGRELSSLVSLAGKTGYVRATNESVGHALSTAAHQNKPIVFLNTCSESEKAFLLAHTKACIMPGVEDFGIAALEANASGKPVVLASESGVAEIIENEKSGIHYSGQNVNSLVMALKKLDQTKFSSAKLQANAVRFSREKFVRKLHNVVFAFYREHSTIKQ